MFELSFAIIILIKTIRPFIRKKLTSNISDENFMFINGLFILVLLTIYNLLQNSSKSNIISSSFDTIQSLNCYQIVIFLFLGAMTIMTTLSMLDLDKTSNQSSNIVLLKGLSTLSAVLFGAYMNNEKLSQNKIIGISIILVGIYFINKSNSN